MFGLICRQKEWDKSNCKLLKFPFSLFTNSVRRHLDECNPFCSFIVYTDAALTLCLLTLRQELIVLISPFFFFWPLPHFLFLLFWVIIVWNQKADLPVLFLEEHTHQTRCLLTTALQDDGKGGLFFFLIFIFCQQWLHNCSKCCTRVQTQELGHRHSVPHSLHLTGRY